MDYKLNLLTPTLYSQEGERNCKDELVERFAEYLKHRADNEFFMRCKHDPIPGLAFIHSFEEFEERFLVHSEYAVIIASAASQVALNRFIPRLLVFLTAKSIWQNRFIFVTLGDVEVLSNLVVNDPIRFSVDQWQTHDEVSWIELFDLIKLTWKPHIEESSETEDTSLSTHLFSSQIDESKPDKDRIEESKPNEENKTPYDETDYRKNSHTKENEKVKQYTSRSVQGSRVSVDTLLFIPTEKEISFKEHKESETNTSPQKSSTDEVDLPDHLIDPNDNNLGQMTANVKESSSYRDDPRNETKDVILHNNQNQELKQSEDGPENKDEFETVSLMKNEIKEEAEQKENMKCDQKILDQENLEETKVLYESELDISRGLHQDDNENNKEKQIKYSDGRELESGINADLSTLLNDKDLQKEHLTSMNTNEFLNSGNAPGTNDGSESRIINVIIDNKAVNEENESKLIDSTKYNEEEREKEPFHEDKNISDDDKVNETNIILDDKLKKGVNESTFKTESSLTNESCEVCDNLTNEYNNIIKNRSWENNDNQNINSQVDKTDNSREVSENVTDEFNNLIENRILEHDDSQSTQNKTKEQILSDTQDSTLNNTVNTQFIVETDSCEVCKNMSSEYNDSIRNRYWENNDNQFIKKEDYENALSTSLDLELNNTVNAQLNVTTDSCEVCENISSEYSDSIEKRCLENNDNSGTGNEAEVSTSINNLKLSVEENVNKNEKYEEIKTLVNEETKDENKREFNEKTEEKMEDKVYKETEFREEEFKEEIDENKKSYKSIMCEKEVEEKVIHELKEQVKKIENVDEEDQNAFDSESKETIEEQLDEKVNKDTEYTEDEFKENIEEMEQEEIEELFEDVKPPIRMEVEDESDISEITEIEQLVENEKKEENENIHYNNSSNSLNSSSLSGFSRLRSFPISIWRRLFSSNHQSEPQSNELITATTTSKFSVRLVQSPWSVLLLFITATAVSPYWVEFTTSSATRILLIDTISSSVLPEDAINRRFAIIPHENQKP